MNFRGPQALKDMDEFRSEEQVLEFWQGIGLVTIVVLRKLSPVQVQESHTPDTSCDSLVVPWWRKSSEPRL